MIWLTLLGVFKQCAGQPAVGAVVNAASGDSSISPGCLISIYGTGLADSNASAISLPLPQILGSTSIRIGGIESPLLFVSPTQINAQVPFEVTQSTPVLTVQTSTGSSAAFPLTVLASTPAIFSTIGNGNGRGLLFDSSFEIVNTLTPGQFLILYATGLGATTPPASTGAGGATAEPLNRPTLVPDLYVGDVKAQLAFAGLAPGLAAVYQINATVPASLRTDRILLQTGDYQSNVVSFQQSYPGTSSVYINTGAAAGTTFDFDAGVSGSQQTAIETAIATGKSFFRSQNLGDPGTTHVFAPANVNTLNNIYSQWLGVSLDRAQSDIGEGTAVTAGGAIFINVLSQGWQTSGESLQPKIVIHELFHVLQGRLADGRDLVGPDPVPIGGPRWLIEGSAELIGYRGVDWAGIYPFMEAVSDQTIQARLITVPLSSLETLAGVQAVGPNQGYPLMFTAVAYLTKNTGLPSLSAYWRALGNGSSWQNAFQVAFGTTVDAFYQDFEAYRAINLPPYPHLSGKVTDASNQPYPGISVYACAAISSSPVPYCPYAVTSEDGTWFMAAFDEIPYILQFGRTSDGNHPDGFYSNTGFTADQAKATRIFLGDTDITGLNVQLPFSSGSSMDRSRHGRP